MSPAPACETACPEIATNTVGAPDARGNHVHGQNLVLTAVLFLSAALHSSSWLHSRFMRLTGRLMSAVATSSLQQQQQRQTTPSTPLHAHSCCYRTANQHTLALHRLQHMHMQLHDSLVELTCSACGQMRLMGSPATQTADADAATSSVTVCQSAGVFHMGS
jgi:hypothetical protein